MTEQSPQATALRRLPPEGVEETSGGRAFPRETLPLWSGHDLLELLTLEPAGPMRFRNRFGDPNAHDRAYGGQILAQALMAAAQTVPAGRVATMMQFLFLQGTLHDRAIDFDVTALQDGKRFSARHVRGSQSGGRLVLDAQLSFALPFEAPAHMAPPDPASVVGEDPEGLPQLSDLSAARSGEIQRVLGYISEVKEVVDFRLADLAPGLKLEVPEPRLRFWCRVKHALPDGAHLHAAAFAYLSDWWINYCAVGGHVQALLDSHSSLYVASLNHAIWLHRPFRADEWLHFDCTSPSAAAGRGLAIARVHDRVGRLVASATQECLMAPSGG